MEYIATSFKSNIYYKAFGVDRKINNVSNIKQVLLTLEDEKNVIFYNKLRIDGKKIYKELLADGYKYIKLKKNKKNNSLYIKENSVGQIYEITVYLTTKKFLKLKNINVIINCKLTDDPVHDLQILEDTLNKLKKIGCSNSSISSFSFTDFVKTIGKNYRWLYPHIDYKTDQQIRLAYNHGVYYLNNIYKNKEVGSGYYLDINSIYPYILKTYPLPYGKAVKYKGKYIPDKLYPYYIQEIYCILNLKKDGIDYLDEEYKDGLPIKHMYVTNFELENLQNNYDVDIIKYGNGWKFNTVLHIFDKFIDKWFEVKKRAKKEKDFVTAKFAKNVLNMIIGQFGRKPESVTRYPVLKNNTLIYKYIRKKTWSIYCPLAIFVVDIGRKILLENARNIKKYSLQKYKKDMYIYSDTDSIFTTLSLDDIKEIIPIDNYDLGKFKIEKEFDNACFIGVKAYIIKIKGEQIAHVSGLQKTNYVNWLKEHNITL